MQASVAVDLYLVPDATSAGRAAYVVRASTAARAHVLCDGSIVHIEPSVAGLLGLRLLAHKPGGSIRVEQYEQYTCGDFVLRRGRVYHRNAVQCDVLEVEYTPCAHAARGVALLHAFVREALPRELFQAPGSGGAEPAGASGAKRARGAGGERVVMQQPYAYVYDYDTAVRPAGDGEAVDGLLALSLLPAHHTAEHTARAYAAMARQIASAGAAQQAVSARAASAAGRERRH